MTTHQLVREPSTAESTLLSVGYEGKSAGELVSQMAQNGVVVVVDVRLTPLSRKPGLSKTKLSKALSDVGIEYIHLRELGNPRDNRAGFRAGDKHALNRYRTVLDGDDARGALARIEALLDGSIVAILCFEHDHTQCHRELVADRIMKLRPQASIVHV